MALILGHSLLNQHLQHAFVCFSFTFVADDTAEVKLCFYSHTMLMCYCKCTCGNELLKEQGSWITHLPPANSPSLSLFSCCRISKNISKGKVIHPKCSDKRSVSLQKIESISTEESQWCCLPAAPALALHTMLVLALLHAFFRGECF